MDYKVIYSARRTLSLCIKNEKLTVRAPYGTRQEKIEAAVSSHAEWIARHMQKQHEKAEREALTDEQIKSLRREAKTILSAKTEYYARLMGLRYGRITVTGAKTRFGSCSSRGNIAYSYRLMLYPEAAVDYVVVHELAHLVEMNHSKRFYAIVEKYLPDYKKRRALLKK